MMVLRLSMILMLSSVQLSSSLAEDSELNDAKTVLDVFGTDRVRVDKYYELEKIIDRLVSSRRNIVKKTL